MAKGDGLDRGTIVIAGVVVLGAFMSILDTTIVNIAIATLGRDFHSSLSAVQWVTTGYLLSLSIVIPLSGWAIERFGAKRVWMLSVALFVAGSILSGVSWSLGSLIAFRFLQGAGGGMILPVGQTIVAQAAGPRRMGRVMSIIGVPMLIGPVLGPVLGGLIVEYTTWRWIFFVNVPIGAAALLLAWRILEPAREERRESLDWRGLLLVSPGLALIVYGLSRASTSGGFGGWQVIGGILLGLALVGAFVVHARGRGRQALLDVDLFGRSTGFSAAVATSFLFGASIFGAMILLPIYYQGVRGEGPLVAGLLLAPQGLGAAMTMTVAGRLTDRLGAGRIVPFGLAVALLGTVAYTQIGPTTSYWLLGVALWVRGLGLGATLMPAMASAYATLERPEVPRATTALNIFQRVGGAMGTALLAVLLERQIRSELPHGGGGGSLSELTQHHVSRLADPLANAFAQTFWVAFAITALAFVPAFLLPRHGAEREQRARDRTPVGV